MTLASIPGLFALVHEPRDSRSPIEPPRRVLGAVSDLFFATRIEAVARSERVTWTNVAPSGIPNAVGTSPPAFVLVDLHDAGVLDAVRALREKPSTRGTVVIGFYSHVETALREAALAAGTDLVLPRSAFTRRLADLLAGRDVPSPTRSTP